MKNERQARILEIVADHEVQTQEAITEQLRSEGFKVTQATVSRDLRDLRLTKQTLPSGGYRYIMNKSHEHVGMIKLNQTMLESITGVAHAMNNVVIKTFPGLAQAVASSVDALDIDSILGCVAGDDTIIVVTYDEVSSGELCEKLRELKKSF